MSLVSFTVSEHADVNELHAEWIALDEDAGALACGYTATRAWYEAFSENSDMEPVILCGRDGVDKAVFILPFVKQKYGPFTVLVRPAMKHLAYYNGLFNTQFAAQINASNTNEFWQTVLGSVEDVDALWIDGICEPTVKKGHPMSYLEYFHSSNPTSMMHLDEDWEAQYAELTSSKKRSNNRRLVRKLEEHGSYEFRIAEGLEEKLKLQEQIFAQKSEFFLETGQHDPFEKEEITAFYSKLIEIDHHSGRPRYTLVGLYVGDHLLGGILGARQSNIFHGMVISRTQGEFSRYSPGRLVLLEMNKYLSSIGVRTHNFGTGSFEYKDSWCDEEMERRHVTYALSAKGAVFLKLLRTAAGLKGKIKQRRLQSHPVIGKLRLAFNV